MLLKVDQMQSLLKGKSKHKFGGANVFKAEQVRKHFVNPKIENEVFGQYLNYIIYSLDFRDTEVVVRRCSYFGIGALKNFAVFTGKHLCSLFLINIQT